LFTVKWVDNKIFKLEEEGNMALLLLLPKLVVKTTVFGSTPALGCWLVVGVAQAALAQVLAGRRWLLLLSQRPPIPCKKQQKAGPTYLRVTSPSLI
jgi:hypothetical protein